MIPTTEQFNRYFERMHTNYNDLRYSLLDAKVDLNAIVGATDKPQPKTESAVTDVLSGTFEAIGLAIPLFGRAKQYYELAKELVAHVKEVASVLSTVDSGGQLVTQLTQAQAAVETQHHNGHLQMIPVIEKLSLQLLQQRELLTLTKEGLAVLLAKIQKSRTPPNVRVARLFEPIDWATPPPMVAGKMKDITYAFKYMLLRMTVYRHVKITVVRWGPKGTTEHVGSRILKFKPEGIADEGCQHIFRTFTRKLDDVRSGVAGMPGTYRIVPIMGYLDLISNWVPDVEMEKGSWGELEDKVKEDGFNGDIRYTSDRLWHIAFLSSQNAKQVDPVVIQTAGLRNW